MSRDELVLDPRTANDRRRNQPTAEGLQTADDQPAQAAIGRGPRPTRRCATGRQLGACVGPARTNHAIPARAHDP